MNLPILNIHISGIIQYMALCVWLLSLGIMFLRIIHVIWLLWTFIYKFLCTYFFPILSFVYSELELLCYVVALCLTFGGNVKLFSKELHHFTFLPALYDGSNFSIPSSTLAVICLFGSNDPSECEVVSHCDFDLYFPNN